MYSGRERTGLVSANYGNAEFFTDQEGVVRLITGIDADNHRHVETRPPGSDEWRELPSSSYGSYFTPLAISDGGSFAYVLDNPGSGRVGLYQLALDGSGYERIYEHERIDVTNAIMSADGRSAYALRVDDGYPRYLIFAGAHPEAGVFKSLLETFAGNLVSIRSRSRDGRYWVVRTGGDVDGGSFYLFDREAQELRLLFHARPDLDPAALASMEPIAFTTFDDRTVHGYFTKARGAADERPAPLVVLVHGGPSHRDYWGFDPEVQVLAAHGFSVLQINFRGSTGYGEEFESLADRQWGDAVQRDIIAGTRWAVEEGLAAEGSMCIMGTSFGAYSAVQSAILASKLYRCVVANAGIYDLPWLYRRGDIEPMYWGRAYLERRVGRDEAELRRYSPVNHVNKLEAPIFIAHGGQDERAPLVHAEHLREALQAHGRPFEWFVRRREGHGFYDQRNRVEYLESALAFLRKHLM